MLWTVFCFFSSIGSTIGLLSFQSRKAFSKSCSESRAALLCEVSGICRIRAKPAGAGRARVSEGYSSVDPSGRPQHWESTAQVREFRHEVLGFSNEKYTRFFSRKLSVRGKCVVGKISQYQLLKIVLLKHRTFSDTMIDDHFDSINAVSWTVKTKAWHVYSLHVNTSDATPEDITITINNFCGNSISDIIIVLI